MIEIELKFTGFLTVNEILKNEDEREPGVYVLCPFSKPYYVGIATPNKSKYWIGSRVKQHIKCITGPNCEYIVFNENFYNANYQVRNTMISRKSEPTKPSTLFLKYAQENAIFWRVKEPRFIPSSEISHPMGRVKDVMGKRRQDIEKIVGSAFSTDNFRVFYFQSPLLDSKHKLECLEAIVKFSLKANTVSKSYSICDVAQDLKDLGISKVKIQCPDQFIKLLFHSFPVDENGIPIPSLQNLVQIV